MYIKSRQSLCLPAFAARGSIMCTFWDLYFYSLENHGCFLKMTDTHACWHAHFDVCVTDVPYWGHKPFSVHHFSSRSLVWILYTCTNVLTLNFEASNCGNPNRVYQRFHDLLV